MAIATDLAGSDAAIRTTPAAFRMNESVQLET
jgi:hypothetical protein